MKPIPQEFIRDYVDSLIAAAKMFPEGSVMRTSALLRADYVMDMVKAFREKNEH